MAEEKHPLILTEEIRQLVRRRLREHAAEFPNNKFEVIAWIDDVDVILAQEMDNFLAEEECKERLKTGGQIIGKGRSQFHLLSKKEIK